MSQSSLRPLLDARVRAAWQAQVAAAVKTPGLLPKLVQRRQELLPRFAAYYTQLRALPRGVRRALQRKLALSLAGVALLLALGQGSALAATINVRGKCTLVDAISAANTDTATGSCPAGSGADTLVLQNSSVHTLYDSGLPVISSQITIAGNNSTIKRDSGAPEFGIFAVSSTGNLTLKEITVSGGRTEPTDSPFGGGGGVFNSGTLTIQDSTLSGNAATHGGGVENLGTLTIQNSTLSGNTASEGGGVQNYGTVTIQNSTLSGNTAYGAGGGVFNSPLGTVTIQNSTLSGNTAYGAGGVLNFGTLTLARTLVSGNTPEIFNDIYGTVTANNYNLFGHDGNAGVVGFTPGATDVVPSEPLTAILDPTLADNGGPTQTHALVPGSPAVDAIPAANLGCTGTDQRGVPRPQGPACDIGAFEGNVVIDIQPGISPNLINLKSKGVISVAILTTATFDATTVDPSTVCFGDAEAPTQRDCTEAHGTGHIEDANGDGDLDLVLHYKTSQTGIDPGDTQVCLTGTTFGGTPIEGCDSVQTQ